MNGQDIRTAIDRFPRSLVAIRRVSFVGFKRLGIESLGVQVSELLVGQVAERF